MQAVDEPGAAGQSPAAWLAAWARRRPYEPFLFYPADLDWRWLSYQEAEDAVSRLAARLLALEARALVAAAPLCASALLVHLAGARVGLPMAAPAPSGPGQKADPPGGGALKPGAALEPLTLDLVPGRSLYATVGLLSAFDPRDPCWLLVPGPEVWLAGPSPAWPASDGERREIVLVAGDGAGAAVRAAVAWSLACGAVLVIEPTGGAASASTLALRPTVAALGARARAELGAALELDAAPPSRCARRFRRRARLHTVIANDSVSRHEVERFARVGVRLISEFAQP